MALGQKLGKIMTGVGSGLSMVPGPWSAIGVALAAGGMTATKVAEGKERREAERVAEEEANRPEPLNTMATDSSRTQQAQMETPQPQLHQQPSVSDQQTGLGGYQSQMDNTVANMLIRDSGGLYGD